MGDEAVWHLICPTCTRPLGSLPADVDALVCRSCQHIFRRRSGIWQLLRDGRTAVVDRFLDDYTRVRHGERPLIDAPEHFQRLPTVAADDPQAEMWRMRAVSFRHLMNVLASDAGPLRIVDVGAGVGWLSHQLRRAGHHPISVDLSVDERDGLGAAHHFPATWPLLRAEFDALPLAGAEADVVVFNASLHYSTDLLGTLSEAARVLRPAGKIIIVDSPVYRHPAAGDQMIAERAVDFERRFGTRSDSVPAIGYLTTERLEEAAGRLGMRVTATTPWYGMRWWWRPIGARLRGARQRARFVTFVVARS